MVETGKIVEKIKAFFFIAGPDRFEKIRKDSFGDILAYYAVMLVVFFAGSVIVALGTNIAYIPMAILLEIIATAIFIIIYFVLAKLLGGQGSLMDMARVFVYGGTPLYLFGWIPYLGIIGLASLWNMVNGTMALFKLSRMRAMIVVLLPLIIMIALFVAMMLYLTPIPASPAPL
ncbi:YIP1 family protein [Candidatus Micrarchaeota archaeon]|nr:YIP1 family protein [Candidatus Micrarchaeota archaeon]